MYQKSERKVYHFVKKVGSSSFKGGDANDRKGGLYGHVCMTATRPQHPVDSQETGASSQHREKIPRTGGITSG
jgi:hypothetical protein